MAAPTSGIACLLDGGHPAPGRPIVVFGLESYVVARVTTQRLDGPAATELRRVLRRLHGERLVIDLTRVESLASSGLGVLLAAAHLMREEEGTVIIAGASASIGQALRAVGFSGLAAFVASIDDVGTFGTIGPIRGVVESTRLEAAEENTERLRSEVASNRVSAR